MLLTNVISEDAAATTYTRKITTVLISEPKNDRQK